MKRTPCSECPFRRESAPGYLGEATGNPQSFFGPIWGEYIRQPCHKMVNWERADAQFQAMRAPLCSGMLIMMRNACKAPYKTETALAVRDTDMDVDSVFRFPHEFIKHHGG